MNKRKGPVFLFGVVVFAVALMAVVNARSRPADLEADMTEKSEEVKEHKLTEGERTEAAKDVLSSLPTKNGDSGKPTPKRMSPEGAELPGASMEIAKKPTILIEKYISSAPTPNDAGTSTHWYDKSSRASKVSDQNARDRG